MAKRAPEPVATHSEVRFERTDITAGAIVKFGIYLGIGVGLVVVSMLWYGWSLQAQHRKRDPLDLPRASTDGERPPEPRLEAQEDLDRGEARMFPPRADEYLKPQREQLRDGSASAMPIESAMDVAKSLPYRKTGDNAPPTSFSRRLPSKASSGKSETGGQ